MATAGDAPYLSSKTEKSNSVSELGHLVKTGTPYSAIGKVDLDTLFVKPEWDGKLDAVPADFENGTRWHYSDSNHASK